MDELYDINLSPPPIPQPEPPPIKSWRSQIRDFVQEVPGVGSGISKQVWAILLLIAIIVLQTLIIIGLFIALVFF